MSLTADRCKETTTTTGTSDITLLGAVAQYQAFATAFSVGESFQYAIVGQTGTEWEVGEGTLLTSSTFSRDKVLASSNSGNVVTLSAGTKDVFATAAADVIENATNGRSLTNARGWALP
mgnify:CR=1 FL=1